MSSFDKLSLNLREPEDALVWLDAFAAKCRAEKKTDVAATASNAADFQVTDQFLFRCGVESLKKLKSLVAPKELKAMPFKDIEKVLKGYLEPQQRLRNRPDLCQSSKTKRSSVRLSRSTS